MANVWMHNGFLQVEGKKMSKSEGNFVTIHELLETNKFGGQNWKGDVARLAMLKTHYRQPIDWTAKALNEASNDLKNWAVAKEAIDNLAPPAGEVVEALAEDLNFSKAVAALHALKKAGDEKAIYATLKWLGFHPRIKSEDNPIIGTANLQEEGDTLAATARHGYANIRLDDATVSATARLGPTREHIERSIIARLAFLATKDFANADRIRNELLEQGIQLKDGKDAEGNRVMTWEVKR
jgi:cysteinyl-tRNA synthetase